ncbi:MAG: HlyD family efflux transporter periplasmic adaptor subunit [Planctomycetota bacterium]|nr:MAG: HlyD family efflux transporter periplasmic adaptor subunit [Planctomycetota bacterium]
MAACPANQRRSGRVLMIAIALVAVLGGGAWAIYGFSGLGSGPTEKKMITATVVRGPFDHIVLEQGEVESSSNIDVLCEVKSTAGGGGGGIPILWVIDEGTYVKKGDKLVELDSSSLENQLKTQRIAVASAEAAVISSEATVRTAEIALQEYMEGTYLSERKTILSELALAQQELRKAELNLASAERLAAKGMIKGLQIEAEQFAVENARNKLEAAEAKLKVLDELTKEKNRVQLESDIEAAKAKWKSDQSVLAEEMDKLREIEDQIAKCVILSPADGVVVYANKYSSRGGAEFVVEEGAIVRERQVILKLPDPSKMQVKANVNESRVTLIAEGMPAKVRVSAVPGDMLARVKRVNKYAEPGSWFSSSIKEYATFIEIIDPPPALRTGMTAEVQIFVEQLPNALQIPVHGVYEYKGHHFCLKKTDSGWETVEIKIGATNDKMVTIEEGLQEGDEIALNPRSFLNMMQLPEVEEITDREKILEIGKGAGKPTPPGDADGQGDRAGAGRADGPRRGPGGGPRGGPGGGGPGGGGPGGGFDPAAIVDRIFSAADADGDGTIAGDELAGLDDRMKDRVAEYDTNGDGALSRQEVLSGMRKRMQQRGGGGGPPGGGRP